MSWDSYVDSLISYTRDHTGTVHCDKGGIISLDGGAPWTTQGGATTLEFAGSEAQTIANCFKSKDFSVMQANGIRISGVKYQFLREEEGRIVYGRCKGSGGIAIQKSKSAIVIGHCAEGSQAGQLNKGVSQIAEYLESAGY
eukprot:GHVU01183311.1.p1 GENE.GHVU01183311.1~~GHVU01183311.1.p1  ORF type:complete len:141 (+),score=3.07 GHVU01183311.1:69-491(+)